MASEGAAAVEAAAGVSVARLCRFVRPTKGICAYRARPTDRPTDHFPTYAHALTEPTPPPTFLLGKGT